MTPELGNEPVVAVLAALAEPTRRHVLDALAARGTATATELAAGLPVTRQAVVKHLAVLDQAGLVTAHRAGREVRYRPAPDALAATARWMADLADAWDQRLLAVKHLAEGTAAE
ncbi:metalloregulator ArsR/SmtB family transcription factor [Streptomyces sp. SP17BM10]|uniref:ArsR/SmtB family transcription factor n=1 Tax=Streptomyces sp. SP17BM10 TaxID=3002530 RepID=UPI002E76ECA9|nr:metalloregulator ArsR/SmtB family transcription factor [Streptomyces sp. SP17BM10]MEE1787533.1 metalloregulator ArsR/SmtB family transcription factor [Streptomyces sp. SP17BM10]